MTPKLLSLLQTHFGFEQFRPGQEKAITNLINGEHTLVVMPTGSGKSLIYQLAALEKPGLTLVISPLIALMKDQVDSLYRRNISATFINSSMSAAQQNLCLQNLAAGRYRIVYVAPERLRSVSFLKVVTKQALQLLAVDEAHCISEWGHDFRPDYLRIADFRTDFRSPLTVALTATATPQVQADIIRLLGLPPQTACVVTGFNRSNLTLQVLYTAKPQAKLQALREHLLNVKQGAVIIYTGTRRDAEEIAEFSRKVVGIYAEHYHAGLEADERCRIQDAFINGRLSVVVATNAFGMGIDRSDVRLVIHYNLPGSLESYYQEAGRAGRDGLPARAVLLYAPDDRALQEWFIKNSETTLQELKTTYDGLKIAEGSQAWLSCDELSQRTSIPEVKVKVALAGLEQAGALEHLGDEGTRMLLKRGPWNNPAIIAAIQRCKQHRAVRNKQLDQMIRYAESNTCRRAILMAHFGDRGHAEAPLCCDNCTGTLKLSPIQQGSSSNRLPVPEKPQVQTKLSEPQRPALSVQHVVVLGDNHSAEGVPELIEALGNRNGNIRRLAASALGKIPDQRAVEPLVKLLAQENKPQVRQYAVKALGKLGDSRAKEILQKIATDITEKDYTRSAARDALKKILSNPASRTINTDPSRTQDVIGEIESFLSHSHPRPLHGPWQTGWALGFHSSYAGKDWDRSPVGQLAYRLKYQDDLTVLTELLDHTASLLSEHPELISVDAIVPVPPSTPRPTDPVSAFAEVLAKRFNLKILPAVVKTRQTAPQKEFHTLAQKRANVAGAFDLQAPVRKLRMLLVDDLFDSGATLEEITRLLQKAGASSVYVLTLTKTIHSDA